MWRFVLAAACLMGLAHASALLATTPACELLTADDVTDLLQATATSIGGTADTPERSDCFWQTGTDAALEVNLTGPEAFKPARRSAARQFDDDVKLIKDSVDLELIADLGERAAIYQSNDAPNVWFAMLVANGSYLQMTVTSAARDRIVIAMETALKRL